MAIFRYPGGKTRLVGPITTLLGRFPQDEFHDVFVGGGSVLVAMAEDTQLLGTRLFANDLNPNIYAFWQLVATGSDTDAQRFVRLLGKAPTVAYFKSLREREPQDQVERAYYAVFFNRTTFSGIYNSGPIGGYEQKSKYKVDARYNAARLVKEFNDLRVLMRGRLTVTNLDCTAYLKSIDDKTCYLDPPYFRKGKVLYPCYMTPEQHVALAESLKQRKNWVLSYDICDEIEKLYGWANEIRLDVKYSINGENRKDWVSANELLITP